MTALRTSGSEVVRVREVTAASIDVDVAEGVAVVAGHEVGPGLLEEGGRAGTRSSHVDLVPVLDRGAQRRRPGRRSGAFVVSSTVTLAECAKVRAVER